MASDTKCGNDQNALSLATGLSNTNLKFEIPDDDFCIDNLTSAKTYLQDFQNLDQFPMTDSSFNPDIGTQANVFDPFDPFYHGTSSDFSLYDVEPYEENGGIGADMQDFQGGGFLNFPDRKDSIMEIETALKYHDPMPISFNVVPDEGSCVTADNRVYHQEGVKKKNNINNSNKNGSVLSKKPSRGRKKSKSAKGQWTVEEDRLLIHLVEKYGVRKWSNIAQMLKGRIGKQCRERWHNHLRPDIKKDIWTEEEDRILIQVHAEVGNKWAEIAKSLPGRTENSIKNHWNATKRRQFSKRKCRTKWPRPSSLLQNYIKSFNFEKGSSRSKKSKNTQPTPTTDPGNLNSTLISAPQHIQELEFCPNADMVPDYKFDDVPEFAFDDDDDDQLFNGSSMDSFMDDLAVGPPPEIDDEPCFDVDLPFDMPPLMQYDVKKELHFLDGNA